jgi:hypothetical protein
VVISATSMFVAEMMVISVVIVVISTRIGTTTDVVGEVLTVISA